MHQIEMRATPMHQKILIHLPLLTKTFVWLSDFQKIFNLYLEAIYIHIYNLLDIYNLKASNCHQVYGGGISVGGGG
jgi:hypothetical protein